MAAKLFQTKREKEGKNYTKRLSKKNDRILQIDFPQNQDNQKVIDAKAAVPLCKKDMSSLFALRFFFDGLSE